MFFNLIRPVKTASGSGPKKDIILDGDSREGGGGGGTGQQKKNTFGYINDVGSFNPQVITNNDNETQNQIEIEYIESAFAIQSSQEIQENLSEISKENLNPDQSDFANAHKSELDKNEYLENEIKAIERIKQKLQNTENKNEQVRLLTLQKLQSEFAEERRKETKAYQQQIQEKIDSKLKQNLLSGEEGAGKLDAEAALENSGLGTGEGIGEGVGSGSGQYAGTGNGNGAGNGDGIGDGTEGGGSKTASECSGNNSAASDNVITVMTYTPEIDRSLVCSGNDGEGRCILKFKGKKQIATQGVNQHWLYYPQFPAVLDFSEQPHSNIVTVIGKNVKVRGLSKAQYRILSPDILISQYPSNSKYKIPGDDMSQEISRIRELTNSGGLPSSYRDWLLEVIEKEKVSQGPRSELARIWTFARERITHLRCFRWGGGGYTPIPGRSKSSTSFLSGT